MRFLVLMLPWLLLVQLTLGVMYRRSSVPGGRLQLRGEEQATIEDTEEGWVGGQMSVEVSSPALQQSCWAIVPFESTALVPVPIAPPAEAARAKHGGRKRKEWHEFATQTLEDQTSLRAATKQWIKEKGFITQPLAVSSSKGQAALLASCDKCLDCSSQWCFSAHRQNGKDVLVVEQCGNCGGEKNLKRLKAAKPKCTDVGVSQPWLEQCP